MTNSITKQCRKLLEYFKMSSSKMLAGSLVFRRPVMMLLVAEWLACWTQAQKGPGSNRSRDAVG